MGFRERQLNLNMGIAEKNYGLNQMQENRITETTKAEFQKDYIPLSGEFDLATGFKAFQQAPPQSIQSSQDIQESFPILGEGLKQGLYANKNLIPETPSMPDNLWEDVTMGVEGTGEYSGKKVNILRHKIDNTERQVPVYQEPKEGGSGNNSESGVKPYKEGELTEAGAKSLAFLTNPTDLGSGFLGIGGTSKEDAQEKLDHNFTIFAKDILSSDSYRYVKNYLDTEGYIEPEVFKLNAINDAQMGRLTKQQINEIATFLNYYDTAYEGIKKIEGYTK
jgi:hypothetical protein